MAQVTGAFGCGDEDVQEQCVQCLKDIAVSQYEYLNIYFDNICSVIGLAMSEEAPDKVAAQAFEFWTALADEEITRRDSGKEVAGFIVKSQGVLLDLVLKGLLKINFEPDDDGDEFGPHMASWFCLQRLGVLLGDGLQDAVVEYSATNLSLPDWQCRYAAIMALGSISEGPTKTKYQEMVYQAMASLLPMFLD